MPRSKPTSNLEHRTFIPILAGRDPRPHCFIQSIYTLYDIRIKMVKFTNYLAPILEIESRCIFYAVCYG